MMESSWRQNIIIILRFFCGRFYIMDTSTLQVVFKFSTHHSSWRVSFEHLPFRRLLRKQMSTNLHLINNGSCFHRKAAYRPLGMQGARWASGLQQSKLIKKIIFTLHRSPFFPLILWQSTAAHRLGRLHHKCQSPNDQLPQLPGKTFDQKQIWAMISSYDLWFFLGVVINMFLGNHKS